jgi:hypothetical protein
MTRSDPSRATVKCAVQSVGWENLHDECTDNLRGMQTRAQQDDAVRAGDAAMEHQLAEILVKRDEYAIILLSEGEDGFIVGAGLEFNHPGNIKPGCTCGENRFARGVFVGEETGHLSAFKKVDQDQAGIG